MSIIATIKEKARADKKYILLPEGTDQNLLPKHSLKSVGYSYSFTLRILLSLQ